jgi:gliding motility-associated lipoprotein GldD
MFKKYKRWILLTTAILVGIFGVYYFFFSRETAVPRKKAYFRIDFPEKKYSLYDSQCPVTFEVPNYAKIENVPGEDGGVGCWFNLFVPRLRATIYCSYFPVTDNLEKHISKAYDFTLMHEVKATAIRRTQVRIDSTKMYGIIYDLEGDAASQLQFFVTDSVNHFMRGVLYFRNKPNADSLAPCLDFMREDVVHMIETMRWK